MKAWKEFLIDPAAFAKSWADCRKLCDDIGWDKGRLMWELPSDWRSRFAEAFKNCNDLKKRLVLERFAELMTPEVPRRRRNGVIPLPEGVPLQDEPWQTLKVKLSQSPLCSGVVTADEESTPGTFEVGLLSDRLDQWRSDAVGLSVKSRESLKRLVSPLLKRSREIILIDPYLDPANDPHRASDLEMYLDLQVLQDGSHFELHLDGKVEPRGLGNLKFNLTDKISPMLRSKQSVECFIWDKSQSSGHFHDRYILTELGGLSLGSGLSSDPAGQRTTLSSILPRTVRESLRKQYHPESKTLCLAANFLIK